MFATQALRDEHEGILVMLDVLEHLAVDLQQGRPVNREHLAQLLDFLRTFADACHHGKEEDLLFPALVAAGLPAQGGPIGVMLSEHTQGREYIRGMAAALAKMSAGENADTEFSQHALGYVELLRAHIRKENMILFSLAEQHLPPAEHARLTRAFAEAEATKIGPGVHERYHAMIRQFRDRYLPAAA